MKVKIGEYKNEGEREIKIHIDDYDLWNLDTTLALIILPCLKKFKGKLTGYPSDFIEKKSGGNGKGLEGWSKTIDKMILAFELILDEDSIFKEDSDKKIKKGLKLFAKYYRAMWD